MSNPTLQFDTAGSFEANAKRFSDLCNSLDAMLSPRLTAALPDLVSEKANKTSILDGFLSDLLQAATTPAAAGAISTSSSAPTAAVGPPTAPPRWFLDRIEIEGFRGINNEGAPLIIKFKSDAVNSVSAPNGVGKSSIYEALSYVLSNGIPKIDSLLSAEKDRDYYLNLFHPAGTGKVKVAFRPDNAGNAVEIELTRDQAGKRTVTGPTGLDAEDFLQQLNREFVLLDSRTFRQFIQAKALERGRNFAGLLGLARYSTLRQQLQSLCNTKFFNSHFDVAAAAVRKATDQKNANTAMTEIARDYDGLVKKPLSPTQAATDAQDDCLRALQGIAILAPLCAGKTFMQVDIEAFIVEIQAAEGGADKKRLIQILHEEAEWGRASKIVPTDADTTALLNLAEAREVALKATSGNLLHDLYIASQNVLKNPDWSEPELCPTCDHRHDGPVLPIVEAKLSEYEKVALATSALSAQWKASVWADVVALEARVLKGGETSKLKHLLVAGADGTLSAAEAKSVAVWLKEVRKRAAQAISDLAQERDTLEKKLPPSLVAVTTAVETARRLQSNWRDHESALAALKAETEREARVLRIKKFLDDASEAFASAESAMAGERLNKVLPVCKKLFADVTFSPVVPSLHKPSAGSEELAIKLAEFWSEKNVSAQALLSESFSNAFAISVYLAAASLYGGPPRFIVLDDVTSSFDAGHQSHIVEVIRLHFALPRNPDGPQVILLSHDTLLEKLFNKLGGSTEWLHQRLEGTPQTAVLLQAGAVNKVRDTTLDLLKVGRVDDAAPRIRQYLEYILHDVIDKCRIPVPMDLAFGDDKKTAGEYLKAIQAAVNLHKAAGNLILEPSQQTDLAMAATTITSNFLSHWSTGQTGTYSAPALLGVMKSIGDFPDFFRYEPSPGAQKKYYRSLSSK